MNTRLAPSIMCAGYEDLGGTLRELEAAGADLIHVDVMDGKHVPNLMLGPDYVKTLRRLVKLPLDIHFMCLEPERFLSMFDPQPGERVAFHPETTRHPHRLLKEIQKRGCLAGAVLGPALPAGALEELAPDLDFITVMSIDTGVPASTFLPRTLDKIAPVKAMGRAWGKDIYAQVDGSIGPDNAAQAVAKGADVLILGYLGCFVEGVGIAAMLGRMKKLILAYEEAAKGAAAK